MTPRITFTLVGDEDEKNIVVFVPGTADVKVAHSSHPYFDKIVAGAMEGDPTVLDLFDLAEAAASKFHRLSERITTANGKLYFDGEEIANVLTNQILRFMDQGVEDYLPLVAFFENVANNPNEHSREQLYEWLARRDFTITPEGMIVGYKGVRKTDEGFTSISSGKAIVNGEVKEGQIPYPLGAVAEMPRSEVQSDPAVGCHRGLHVGDYEYASGFSQGALLEVHVNPRDVVSVPTECNAAKMRVCRFVVVDTIDSPYSTAILGYAGGEGWGDGEWDDDDEGEW